MIDRKAIERVLTYSPLVAALIYGAVVILLIATTSLTLAHLYSSQSALADIAGLLERLEGRKPATTAGSGEMNGSPLIEGPTVTVAGAALLQRVVGAVTKAGGTVRSSQVDLAGGRSGAVKLAVSSELDLAGLQRLLYDLEAGMPFLFVEQLDVQAPQAVGAPGGGGGRMHVQFTVSGQWQGGAR
jgi:general secretion pathway protein M